MSVIFRLNFCLNYTDDGFSQQHPLPEAHATYIDRESRTHKPSCTAKLFFGRCCRGPAALYYAIVVAKNHENCLERLLFVMYCQNTIKSAECHCWYTPMRGLDRVSTA